MAATIPPPAPMKLSGNLSANWEIFRAEYEDYALATELVDKPEGVQAATLRSVMGAECRHVYKHNLNLSNEEQADVTVILNSLERYFKPAKNVIYERYVFGCCKQEEGSTSEEMGLMHFTIPEELRVEGLNTVDDSLTMPLTRNTVVRAYHDVFTSPVEAVPGEVHFELDPAVCTTQLAPEVYHRKQHELLEGLEGVEPIADDILVVGCGDSEDEACKDHDAKLVALLDRCRQVKLRLSVKKLQFRVSELRFHGHILSAAGLKADPEKVRAVLEMPAPSDVKGVQRFIGFVTYLAKFLPRLSEVCEPLRRLTDKDAVWHWLPKHDAAVREIKQLVTMTPVLRYYNVSKPVTVQ
ncbi:hypothetical protein SKAU_G00281120 [Synaphobranchus kaupii]|uniref:Reverse transcriptase/retrotransposon-derived protein RNase H-like domain-containing protein n=1 Tax=Synaphobranchus kaupii TaxID=118154 RepID=A0A9Q1EX46_SYNKA|nr:hypothetical protein SKAU_G00281120 [Synaphobranchus kaupii]